MAKFSIIAENGKIEKVLNIDGEEFKSVTESTHYGCRCEKTLLDKIEENHPDWIDNDDIYTVIEDLDNINDLDILKALDVLE